MLLQELQLGIQVALADLAEHPADSLVHQVVLVVQKLCGELQGVAELPGADKGEGGEDGDTLLPEVAAGGKTVENFPFFSILV